MASPAPLQALLSSTGTPSANRSSSSLITPPLLALADPPQHTVDARLVEFFVQETIRTLLDSTKAASERRKREHESIEAELASLGLSGSGGGAKGKKKADGADPAKEDEEEVVDEEVRKKLEGLGFKVGWATAERLSRDRPRFPSTPTPTPTSLSPSLPYTPPPTTPDPLEAIKFVCKDVWVSVFDKQVDNLRTNHRGVWVVLDTSLRGLRGVSVPPRREGAGAAGKKGETEEEKQLRRWVGLTLSFPSGLIRGSLSALGISSTVTGESSGLPQATFQIRTVGRPGQVG
ncbi:TRAPP complex subunit trs33 [Rhodotorula toruloides ATCC 204091]|uniref:BY PROTMAP: gi/472585057/gb/EMS22623.1/ bet3 family protein [Rhodosporidium toruloides NP11] gi/647403378/emb/CDR49506.1/ RHTO0S27e01112g1_1 [Rhodosporidium toruloides] n=1 Tax=Rhodotorula toruloides TaxID=5286 RepID=A0A0K3CJD0_RHOTO|nr:TRAPP complex subunit trs33 [Rhodotorula toruloides ATCC 204091]KAK4336466.1 bet3 family protein [Rhodotorula toruloides]PRQ74184.1 Transport protein particle (TRAPP) component-domain containing protein [Rhodotorula toruloides]